ncbi:hypothetical protein H8B09_12145 [Paenibacillus sp. PR3]|uniref:Uncharacterized protein n=1 Tax=Paenibacillus terricola TaxID=2763503 RepID=A0ABR8MWR9_9BACL|nr:hypothetical protein [Paenibacillus terricola]MBD3919506.1 hypothetical protein [Paenibacillus terricola]
MKKESKIFIESIFVPLILLISFELFFLQGYLTIKDNNTKVFNYYLETAEVSNQVSFVWWKEPFGWLEYILIFLIISIIYYLIRYSLWKLKRKRDQ